jgi:TctA family transporter
MKDHLRRKVRSIGLVALLVFVISFIVGFVVLSASAGSLGFWHVWHWFA